MEPILFMIMLAVLVPIVGLLLIGLPVYVGVYYALYALYQPAEDWVPHPLTGRFWEINTMVAQYIKLVEHTGLTLQVALPPVVGLCAAAMLLYSFYRYVRGQFTVDDL